MRRGVHVQWCVGRERTGTYLHQPSPPTVQATAVPPLLSPQHLRVVSWDDFSPSTLRQHHPVAVLLPSSTDKVRFGLLGRLLNEYLVDMFSSMEDNRLKYIRLHVQKRIAAQSELDETIDTEGGHRAGRGITQDAEEVDRGWPGRGETSREADVLHHNHLQSQLAGDLRPSGNARDRPDLFRAKLQKMMASLKTGLLGKKIYHMYVVEFQK